MFEQSGQGLLYLSAEELRRARSAKYAGVVVRGPKRATVKATGPGEAPNGAGVAGWLAG